MQKSILITGCSSGIGYDCAITLHEKGWQVFASCRQQKDCDRLIAMGLESPRLDHNDAKSMRAALDYVLSKTGGTLDALFNNGAFALPGAVEDLPTDGLRSSFETNLFGYHELTLQVLPIMRAQGHGRIINNSSILGLVTMRWRGAYTATKFAMEGLTDALRIELRGTNIHPILVEPGPITSNIRENAISHFEKWIDWKSSPHRVLYEAELNKRLYEPEEKKDRFELPASAVTKKIIHALESHRPRPRYYVTTLTYIMGFLKRVLPTRALDWVAARV